MIGGPNQSHKVNFKEPLPAKGKISKRTFAFCFVNPFPDFSEKSFVKEHYFLRPFVHLTRVSRERFTEGIAEHGNCIFLIKIFLDKKTNATTSIYSANTYMVLKSQFCIKIVSTKKPNIANCRLPGNVSKLVIHTMPLVRRMSVAASPSTALCRDRIGASPIAIGGCPYATAMNCHFSPNSS